MTQRIYQNKIYVGTTLYQSLNEVSHTYQLKHVQAIPPDLLGGSKVVLHGPLVGRALYQKKSFMVHCQEYPTR